MPPDETELVKAGVDAALAPVKDLLNRLLGPVADELGGLFADPVRVFRLRRRIRLLEKVKAVCEEAGIEPKAVAPPKTLLPILENASLEDDEELNDRWANLLANAATSKSLPSAFPDILRQLSTSEVQFLDHFCCQVITAWQSAGGGSKRYTPATGFMFPILSNASLFHEYIESTQTGGYLEWLMKASGSLVTTVNDSHERFALSTDNLLRLRLIDSKALNIDQKKSSGDSSIQAFLPDDCRPESRWFLTALGFEFVSACRKPNKTGEVAL